MSLLAPSSPIGFNPRPYVRGDVMAVTKVVDAFSFNPRPYVRGDALMVSVSI